MNFANLSPWVQAKDETGKMVPCFPFLFPTFPV